VLHPLQGLWLRELQGIHCAQRRQVLPQEQRRADRGRTAQGYGMCTHSFKLWCSDP
jgi:hypothetical protein